MLISYFMLCILYTFVYYVGIFVFDVYFSDLEPMIPLFLTLKCLCATVLMTVAH